MKINGRYLYKNSLKSLKVKIPYKMYKFNRKSEWINFENSRYYYPPFDITSNINHTFYRLYNVKTNLIIKK